MFTGLVADTGVVGVVDRTDEGVRLRVDTVLAVELAAGDSIAVNGVCLTARHPDPGGFRADVMMETVRLLRRVNTSEINCKKVRERRRQVDLRKRIANENHDDVAEV